jgi:hypothetical protein
LARHLDCAQRVTAKVDGTFDRTGLPDPLVLSHHITVKEGKIAMLRCRPAGSDSA